METYGEWGRKDRSSTQDLITQGSQRKQDQRSQSNLLYTFLRESAVSDKCPSKSQFQLHK